MSDSSLEISVEHLKRVDLITAKGRIDSSNAAQFDEVLKESIANGQNNLVLDLEGIEYMSSAGLRAIVAALRECKSNRGDVRIGAHSERVAEVFQLAGLARMFQIFDDTTTAVGSF